MLVMQILPCQHQLNYDCKFINDRLLLLHKVEQWHIREVYSSLVFAHRMHIQIYVLNMGVCYGNVGYDYHD